MAHGVSIAESIVFAKELTVEAIVQIIRVAKVKHDSNEVGILIDKVDDTGLCLLARNN